MRTVPFTNFCTVVRTASNGTYSMIRFGTGVVSSPMYAIMNNYNQEVICQGRYKWVNEVFNRDFANAEDLIQS